MPVLYFTLDTVNSLFSDLQVSWVEGSKLTVNLGMRWDYQRPFMERFDRRVSDYDSTEVNPISGAAQAAYAGILNQVLADPVKYPFGPQLAQLVPVNSLVVYGAQKFAGVDGQPRTASESFWNQWQPRHLQHERWGLFQAGYTHNKTSNILRDRQQNDIGLENWLTYREPRFDASGKPLAKPYLTDEQIPNPFYRLPGVTGSRGASTLISIYDLMHSLKVFGGQARTGNPVGTNQYDAFEAKVERRYKNGFSIIAEYTFSKLFEDTSFWGNEIAGRIEHKLGGEDRPHKLSIAPIIHIPYGRRMKWGNQVPKWAVAVVGGWQLSGQYIVQSGAPIVFGTNSFFDGQDFHISRGDRTLDKWFETSHFVKFPSSGDDISQWPAWTGVHSMPGASYKPKTSSDPKNGVYADFGNYLRDHPTRWGNARSSRVNELNFGLFKNFTLMEGLKAQFRGEFFNLFNHPRFGGPETNPGSSSFGVVSPAQVNQQRVVQLALKLSF